MIGPRVEIFVPDLPEPASHYAHVVRAGGFVFVSGCSALDAEGTDLLDAELAATDATFVVATHAPERLAARATAWLALS